MFKVTFLNHNISTFSNDVREVFAWLAKYGQANVEVECLDG